MKQIIHRTGAFTATLCIGVFWISTFVVELFGSVDSIIMVKNLIVMPGLFILLPAMAITGGTGFALAKSKRGQLVEKKKKRMPFIAATGLFLLLPSAIFLDHRASAGLFDTQFYLIQGLEFAGGGLNLFLLRLNIRDGLKMSGKLSITTTDR